jgi:hypothetical protein
MAGEDVRKGAIVKVGANWARNRPVLARRRGAHGAYAGGDSISTPPVPAMTALRYWCFPVADGEEAILVATPSHTEIVLVNQESLPHFITQLECARGFSEPLSFND